MSSRIPVAGPWITELEVAYVTDAVRNGWYDRAGEYPARFEGAFAKRLGVRHAVALPSCTSAIHLSLAALGVGPGDEVIVPDLTWIASAAPIHYVGATPVFADVDPKTWCLTASSVEACITPRTRAVIAVDLYGNMPHYASLCALLSARGIPLIEDAAEALGSEQAGRMAGVFGVAGTFSFHGSKTLTTGEGGMWVSDDDALHARVLALRDHGRTPGDPRMFFNQEVGFKYRMSALQAALGLAQLERLDELVDKKRHIFRRYQELLAPATYLALNAEPPQTKNSYWMSTVTWGAERSIDKIRVVESMRAAGADCRPIFYALSGLPAFAGQAQAALAATRNTNTRALEHCGVNLPSALNLRDEDLELACRALRAIFES